MTKNSIKKKNVHTSAITMTKGRHVCTTQAHSAVSGSKQMQYHPTTPALAWEKKTLQNSHPNSVYARRDHPKSPIETERPQLNQS